MNRKLQASSVKHQAPESGRPEAWSVWLVAPRASLSVAGLSLVLTLGLLGFLSCGKKPQTQSAMPKGTAGGLLPVEVDGESGYMDRSGRLVITPQFGHAGHFSEGLAAVEVGDIGVGKWGYMDTTGTLVIKPQFDCVWSFSEGLAAVRVGDENTGRWGYINKTGEFVVKPQFLLALNFHEGLAAVDVGDWKNRKWGFIDTTGKFVINPQFDGAKDFSRGKAEVTVADKCGHIDKTGEVVWEPSK